MSRLKRFTVDISLETAVSVSSEFGGILIYQNEKELPFTSYKDITELKIDYPDTTDTYKMAVKLFGHKPSPSKIMVMGSIEPTPAEIITDLESVINKEWLVLMCTDNANATITALDTWVDAQKKMYAVTTQDLTMFTTGATSENTWIGYHSSADAYIAEIAMVYLLVNDIGSVDPFLKTFYGVPESTITDPQLTALDDAGGFTYIKDRGVMCLTESKTASGEFVDVVLGKYWIKFTMEQKMFELAKNNKKIGYTTKGISQIIGVLKTVIQQGADQGIVLKDENGNPSYTYTFKTRDEMSQANRAVRKYDGINWSADLEGSIHDASINGVLRA